MQHTLNSIATSEGVEKRTVQNWLKKAVKQNGELGVLSGTARLFSDADRDVLLSFKSDRKRAEPVVPVQVYTGNHRVIESAPIVPAAYDLSYFRSDQDCVMVASPMNVVDQVTAIVTGIKGAMQADANQQQAKLIETQQAIDALTEQEQILRDEAILYRLRTETTTGLLNQATQRLNQKVGKLQALGTGPG